ncbi:Na/Pi cotransporter family protein [Kordiimonas sp.]|uniref:Na/Pi cotransporter family protein n=1 Tax=Kordiimonas sp. TaxID=1970157 RepID=UPI003A91F420
MTFESVGQLVGGLGLLLLALGLMTDGLRLAAGDRLITVLKKSTTPAWRGVLSGVSVTAIVQSSSAVTVATIGFVNAGLMSLAQAISVIFGTNVGTTITGWIVASVGFELDISAFALVMVGAGVAVKLVSGERPRSGYGVALAGFGLFFLGIGFLKGGFEGLSAAINFQVVNQYGAMGILLGMGLGFIVTVLAQSSSAAVVLILTATSGGAVMLPTAAAMIIGANIGTTSTAVLATVGATSNARRVGLAHIIFNVITGVVAFLLLLLALPFADQAASYATTSVFLAVFHTAFNVLGVLLVWPWRDRLAVYLETCFRTREEDEQKPRYLDYTLRNTPQLAVQALIREVSRIDEKVARLAIFALSESAPDLRDIGSRRLTIRALVREVYAFVGMVQRTSVTPQTADDLGEVMRIAQYYREATDLVGQVRGVRASIVKLEDPGMRRAASRYIGEVVTILTRQGETLPVDEVLPLPDHAAGKVKRGYHGLRTKLLQAVVTQDVPPVAANELLDTISTLNRLVARAAKANALLKKLAGKYGNGGERSSAAAN